MSDTAIKFRYILVLPDSDDPKTPLVAYDIRELEPWLRQEALNFTHPPAGFKLDRQSL
eukprot:CAMPEP_0174902786 /NCGR_PEP_ID=MMETSP0167-20121228/39880_1 /TAXON_ID=38298 /ORGANISM="Rhodella maculata, Strain CCMP736" /LENGTH=57 /DNA_ID=CAMNT_0016144907 /DNA_START=79 /DNA_END=248 /DNA_ORIENTATION=-